MRSISPRRVVLLATLFLLLIAAPWASAAPRHGSAQPMRASVGIGIPDVLSLAWRVITRGWIKTGCTIEPDGRCLSVSSPATQSGNSANGASGDRSRGHRPALPTKIGCTIEPDGRCIS
jgi:hypothetical protein